MHKTHDTAAMPKHTCVDGKKERIINVNKTTLHNMNVASYIVLTSFKALNILN